MSKPITTFSIIIINIIVFILQQTIPLITHNYSFILQDLLSGQKLYTLITYMFLHSSYTHLGWNMFVFFVVGWSLEVDIGSVWMLFVFLISGVIGILGHVIASLMYLLSIYPTLMIAYVVGSSGAIYGIFGTLIVVSKKLRDDNVLWKLVIFYISLDVLMLIFSPSFGMCYSGHISGFVCGYGLSYIVLRFI